MLHDRTETANSFSLALSYQGREIRVLGEPSRPEFVASDVCQVLGITLSQTRRLKDFEKVLRSTQTLGGPQNVLCITESGLYRLTFRSRKPAAEAFQNWVFEEVLPTIRKHGQYPAPMATPTEGTHSVDVVAKLVDVVAGLVAKVEAIDADRQPAVATPTQPRITAETLLTAWGKTQTLGAWARDPGCKVTLAGLKYRIAQGWPADWAIAKDPTSKMPAFDGRQRILKLRG